jgi:hypothetical protein
MPIEHILDVRKINRRLLEVEPHKPTAGRAAALPFPTHFHVDAEAFGIPPPPIAAPGSNL